MGKKVWGYARVSSRDQNLERQLIKLREFVSDERYILCEKESGKSLNRPVWNSLVGTADTAPRLNEGDLLVVCSLDRIGRNYTEMRNEWRKVVDELKCDIKVVDMEWLDTSRNDRGINGRFIANLIFEILSYIAEREREEILVRQRQGIDSMPIIDGKRVSMRTKRPIGRPCIMLPDNWNEVYQQYIEKNITGVEAMKILKLKKSSFYMFVKAMGKKE